MKINQFRVRDRIHPKIKIDQPIQNNQDNHKQQKILNNDQLKLSSLLQSFEKIITELVKSNNNKTQVATRNYDPPKEVQYRDRFVLIDLPLFSDQKIDLEKLQPWIGQVCEQSLSVAFHYFVEKKINYDQMKAFASESLLRNIVTLAQNYHLTPEVIRFIDDTMDDKILPFLKAKYPLSVQRQVNKALETAIKTIDNSETIVNDYFITSDIRFEYRENGRYDDLIMSVLNQLITRIDNPSQSSSKNVLSNFKEFKNMMTQIFEKSFDEDWMQAKDPQLISKVQKDAKEKQKYQQTVKEYTSYLIGRKISQNTEIYSEDEIKNQYLSIKSPAILRILTKWCDELWAKYDNENYYVQRTDGLLLNQSKKIGLVFPWIKAKLKVLMQKQKLQILEFMRKIQEINYKQQVDLLQNQILCTDSLYIDKLQRNSGKFACKIVNNVESFIVDYLNRLIHGLVNVSRQAYYEMATFKEYWPSAYHLISFNVSDLLRCKYTSKQKEVLKIYKEIQRLESENPEKFKIIKLKNRLKNATNDIMIIAKLNNSINCQIQIAVNNLNSEFMNCSNKINHYIYQLERSIFGPILQMCSIWKSCEKRSELFNKLIKEQKPRKHRNQIQVSQCVKGNKRHDLIEERNPFVCSECSKHYYHNNFMVNHLKCRQCHYWKCARCLVQQKFEKQNRDFFFQDDKLKLQYQFWKEKNTIPQYGACIFINRPTIEVNLYKKMNYNFKDYLVHRKNNQVSILKEVTKEKDIKKLLKESIIFQLPSDIVCQELKFNTEEFQSHAITNLFIPEYILNCIKQEKEGISLLTQKSLYLVNFDKIYSRANNKLNRIQSIQFSSNNLAQLDFISTEFVNLKRLNLNLNHLKEFSKVCEFKKLEKIQINQNQISQLPSQIGVLKELKQLYLFGNQIRSVPQSFSLLSSLNVLSLSSNFFSQIPQSLSQLHNLKELQMKKNSLKIIPLSLFKLKNLTTLNLELNQIQQIPEQIDELLTLKYINLSLNSMKKLTQKIEKFPNLTTLQIAKNLIDSLPQSLFGLKKLQTLNLNGNQLTLIPDGMGNLQNLSSLNLSRNKIENWNSCLFKLSQLTFLDVSQNILSELGDNFDNLKKLKHLDIADNKLKQFPSSVLKIKTINKVYIRGNQFQSLDLTLFKDQLVNNYIDINNMRKLKQITFVAPFAHKVLQVTKINISENSLEKFPEWVFTEFSSALHIDLSDNKVNELNDNVRHESLAISFTMNMNLLTSLPPSFGRMKLLQELQLQNNQIKEFPIVICELMNLKKLRLNYNKIVQIPQQIGALKKLQLLQIGNNQLLSIPEGMSQLSSLKYARFGSNQIQVIPLGLCRLTQLIQLELYYNFVKVVPSEINQMLSLAYLGLQMNQIKQVGDQEFVASKCPHWLEIQAGIKIEQGKVTNHPIDNAQ